MYRALNQTPEIEMIDTSGTVVRRIRVPLEPNVVTKAVRETYAANHAAGFDSDGRLSVSPWTRPFADTAGYFGRMLIGEDGTIWVSLVTLVTERWKTQDGYNHTPEKFLILSSEGRLIATTSVPPNARLISVAADRALLTYRDEEDHELVKVVPIRRR